MPPLTLQLSCYNGARYLPFLFASLRKQTLQEWRLLVLDNASTEPERDLIRAAVSQAGFPIELFRVEKNIGFAGAHNFLFEKHKRESEYVALLNDDAILEPEYLAKLVKFLETHLDTAAAEGIVYRWNFDRRDEADQGKTTIIDTLGLKVSLTGAVSDIGAGENNPSMTPSLSLFGVSGCLPCYRVQAVRNVSLQDTLFDSTFVIYKEDVELAFRLQTAGLKAVIVPEAIAYHRRSLGRGVKHTPDPQAGYRSYLNHLWVHLMHARVRDLFGSRCLLLPYEGLKCIYWLTKKPRVVFEAICDTKANWKHLMRTRTFMRVLRDATKQKNKKTSFTQRLHDSTTFQSDIAVIMVSHNDLSEACLRSFVEARARTSLNVKLVVADNDSKKYFANEFVEAIVPDAIVLLRHKDHGYGRSCNRAAREWNAKYYFILNPDTVLTDLDIFNKCYTDMESHPEVGLIAPKIFYFDGRLQETCRRFPKWFVPFVTRTRIEQTTFGKNYMYSFAMRDFDHSHARDVDWVQGSAMFVRGDVWRLLDGFDDRYWLYFEDIDLCRRIHTLGKSVLYNPDITLQHAHGKESATHANIFVNLLKKKEARGHIISWLKYLWKWK